MALGGQRGLSAFETLCSGFLPVSFFPVCFFPPQKKKKTFCCLIFLLYHCHTFVKNFQIAGR